MFLFSILRSWKQLVFIFQLICTHSKFNNSLSLLLGCQTLGQAMSFSVFIQYQMQYLHSGVHIALVQVQFREPQLSLLFIILV